MSIHQSIDSIAIVGAGMAGLSCALALRDEILDITVFEQADIPGGRMVTRQFDQYQFDSGAQYFTVRSDTFEKQVKKWQDEWLLDAWQAWIVDISNGQMNSHDDDVTRYIGRPYMHSFVEDMAELCDIRYSTEIKRAIYHKKTKKWQLTADQYKGMFDAVVFATPAPLAAPFLKESKSLSVMASQVQMTSCWSVMLAFESSLGLGLDAAYVVDDVLAWIACDSGKIERNNEHETWVIHVSPEWSEAKQKLKPKKVIAEVLKSMERVSGRSIPEPIFATAELWRHARPVNVIKQDNSLYDAELQLGACGDWCYAPKVEGAYLSGLSMAAKIINSG